MKKLILGGVLAAMTVHADQVLTVSERVVALTILGEARGEGKMGMYAVACVIQKRSIERSLTPAKVCHEPWQFSIWNAGGGKVKKERELYYLWKSKSAQEARKLARLVCKKSLKDPCSDYSKIFKKSVFYRHFFFRKVIFMH